MTSYNMPFLAKRTALNNISQISTDGTAPSDEEKALLFDGDDERRVVLNADNEYFYLTFTGGIACDFILLKNCNFKHFAVWNFPDGVLKNAYSTLDNTEKDILIYFEKQTVTDIYIWVQDFFEGSSIEIGEIIIGEKLYTFTEANGVVPKIEIDSNIILNRLSNNTYHKVYLNKVENINLDVQIISQTERQTLLDAFKYAFRQAVVCVPNPRPKAVVQNDFLNRIVYENTGKTYFDGVGGTYHWLDWQFDKEIGNSGYGEFTGFIELVKASDI